MQDALQSSLFPHVLIQYFFHIMDRYFFECGLSGSSMASADVKLSICFLGIPWIPRLPWLKRREGYKSKLMIFVEILLVK